MHESLNSELWCNQFTERISHFISKLHSPFSSNLWWISSSKRLKLHSATRKSNFSFLTYVLESKYWFPCSFLYSLLMNSSEYFRSFSFTSHTEIGLHCLSKTENCRGLKSKQNFQGRRQHCSQRFHCCTQDQHCCGQSLITNLKTNN